MPALIKGTDSDGQDDLKMFLMVTALHSSP